jgi:hypothetical protein
MIQLRTLQWENYPTLPRRAQCNQKRKRRAGESMKEMMEREVKMMQQPLRMEKAETEICPSGLHRE